MESFLIYLVVAYLVGALPTGTVAARLLGRGSLFDPGQRQTRRIGDVFKVLGLKVGLLVTFFDVLKGTFVVWPLISLLLGPGGHQVWWVVSSGALCAVIGHCNSAFLGFRGGRGLATSFGALLPLLPVPTLGSSLVYASLAFWGLSTRPGALSGAGILPIFSILWVTLVQPERQFYLYVVAFLSLWTLWEQRESLEGYLGLHFHPPDPSELPPIPERPDSPEDPEKRTPLDAPHPSSKTDPGKPGT
jgi:acyl phosphate:glycerol-3-phosphate acyltransferase